jgi:hypothetical protein
MLAVQELLSLSAFAQIYIQSWTTSKLSGQIHGGLELYHSTAWTVSSKKYCVAAEKLPSETSLNFTM